MVDFAPNFTGFIKDGARYWRGFLPILISLVAQRLLLMIDADLASSLGKDWVNAHNIFFTYQSVCAFIVQAGISTLLVLWVDNRFYRNQLKLILASTFSTVLFVALLGLVFNIFHKELLAYFHVPLFLRVDDYYFFSTISTCLFVIFLIFESAFVCIGKKRIGLIFILFVLSSSKLISYCLLKSDLRNYQTPLLFAQIKCFLYLGSIAAMLLSLQRQIARNQNAKNNSSLAFISLGFAGVYFPELLSFSARAVAGFLYSMVLASFGGADILTSYTLWLHIIFVICMPITAAGRISLNEASLALNTQRKLSISDAWSVKYIKFALAPCLLILIFSTVFMGPIMLYIYSYSPAASFVPFVVSYSVGTFMGQIGNSVLIPIRAMKGSSIFFRNIILSELLLLVGGSYLAARYVSNSPTVAGFIVVCFGGSYLFLNLISLATLAGNQFKFRAPWF